MTAAHAISEEAPRSPDGADSAAAATVRGRVALERVVLGAPPLLLLVLGWQRRWIADDGLIVARTVRQILAGNGPVYNPGERVEASTSVLWTWLAAGLTWVTHSNVYAVLQFLGLLLAPLGLLLALLGARTLHRRAGATGALVPFGAIVVLALPPFWDFVTSGLEESLIFCWIGLCWYLLTGLRADSARRAYALVFVAGLGWLVRPDLAIATLGILAAAFVVLRPSPRRSAGLIAVAGALPFAYEIFRMGYYGLLVPNTALTKDAANLRVALGLRYLVNYIGPYALWLPVLVIVLSLPVTIGWRRLGRDLRVDVLAVAASGIVMIGYVIAIGGDFMHARMFLPGTFLLLLPIMAVPLPGRAETLPGLALARQLGRPAVIVGTCACVLAGWAMVAGVSLRAPRMANRPLTISNERMFWVRTTKTANPVTATPYIRGYGKFRAQINQVAASGVPMLVMHNPNDKIRVELPLTRPGVPVAATFTLLGTLGAIVPLDGTAVDIHGLSYALGSHFYEIRNGRPGHSKTVQEAWIIADYTNAAQVPGVSTAAIAAARHALRCGAIAKLRQATQAPLTWGQFWQNVAGSFSLTTLRIPNDPLQAERAFCGH